MDLQIRAARSREFPAIIDLLKLCFDEASREFFIAQTEHDSTFRLRHARVAVDDGRVVAYVRIFARHMLVRGVPVAAGGIGSVATHPDVQGRGIATALLRDAVEQMKREGMSVSFLFTGIPGFYERLGYGVILEPEFTAERADVMRATADAAARYDTRTFDPQTDLPPLLTIYRRAIRGTTGAIVRTPRTWSDARHWLGESACAVASDEPGAVAGYIRSRCRDVGHQVLEAECAAGHERALAALLATAGKDRCRCHTIIASVPTRHPLADLLRRIPGASETTDVQHPMMVRSLSDDAGISAAFVSEPMYFWNSDRI